MEATLASCALRSSSRAITGEKRGQAWQVQEAKARFGAFLEASAVEGPQIVTKRGVEEAVLLSIEQWRRLRKIAKLDLKALLLAPEARTDVIAPPRTRHGRRPALALE